MLCPHCGNRMFDDGLDDILYCGACHNYEKKGRNSAQIIASYNRSRERETERETVARQLAETETEKRERARRFVSQFYTIAPFGTASLARGNA